MSRDQILSKTKAIKKQYFFSVLIKMSKSGKTYGIFVGVPLFCVSYLYVSSVENPFEFCKGGDLALRCAVRALLRSNTMRSILTTYSPWKVLLRKSFTILKPLARHPVHSCAALSINVCTFRYQIHWHENSLTKEPTRLSASRQKIASNNLVGKIAF